MAQFIIFTDAHGTKHRVNVDQIVYYAERDPYGTNLHMTNGIKIEVEQNVEAMDQLIRNTDTTSVLSQR